jgi:hypothetical protein
MKTYGVIPRQTFVGYDVCQGMRVLGHFDEVADSVEFAECHTNIRIFGCTGKLDYMGRPELIEVYYFTIGE